MTPTDDFYRYWYDYRSGRVERTENGETTLLTFRGGLGMRKHLDNGP